MEVNCTVCGEHISVEEDRISCNQCKSDYHRSCTIINDNIEVWSCPKCNSGVLKVPPPPKSHRTRSHCSQRSKKTHSSSSSKVELLLQNVEEEKKMLDNQQRERQKLLEEKLKCEYAEREKLLEEKHKVERELLLKKQQILNENHQGSVRGSVHLSVSSVSSKEKVASWVNANEHHNRNTISVQQIGDTSAEKIQDQNANEPLTHSTIVNTGGASASHNKVQRQLIPSCPIGNEPIQIDQQTTKTSQETARDNVTFYDSQIRPSAAHSLSVSRTLSKEQIAARHVLKELPAFDGSPRSWPKFISSFQRSTDLCGYSDSENLERLTRCLKGSAYTAVESSLTLEDNLPRILETLELLFGKPEYIINNLLEVMRKTKHPTIESVESILCYALEIENISCTMRLAKLSEHLWNPVLLNEMIERLPSQLKLDWAESTYKKSPCNIEVFSAWLKEKSMKLSSLLSKPPVLSKPVKGPERNKASFVNVHDEALVCYVCDASCKNLEVCKAFKELNYQSKWDIIKKNSLCRTCLRKHKGHCRKQQVCGVNGCEYFHHELLHKPQLQRDELEETIPASVNAHTSFKFDCIFKVLPVTIYNGSKFITTYAMLDDCSSLTLISQNVADKIAAQGPKQALCLQWTSNIKRVERASKKLTLQITGKANGKRHNLNCRTVENLSLPRQSLHYQQLASQFPHLEGLPVSSYSDVEIGILIGMNNPTLLLTHNYKMNKDDEPIAAFTKLGCVIFGSNSNNNGGIYHVSECDCFRNDVTLDNLLRENYSVEHLGLRRADEVLPTEDKRAFDIWKMTTKFLGNKYETGLLFKYNKFQLPNSFNMATRRLQCLLKKCEREPGLREIISSQIEEYEKKGYSRKVSKQELQRLNKDLWYLPIFALKRKSS